MAQPNLQPQLEKRLWGKFLGLGGGFQNPVTDPSRKPTKNPQAFQLVQRKFPNQTQRFHTKAYRYAVKNPSEKIFKFFSRNIRAARCGPANTRKVALPHPTRLSSGAPDGTRGPAHRSLRNRHPGARGQVSEGRAPHSPSVSLRRPPRPPAAARASRHRRAGDP